MPTPENNAAYLKQLRIEAAARGDCSICRCRRARIGRKTCAECVATAKHVEKVRRKKYRAAGLCACGRKPQTGFRACALCNEKGKRWNSNRTERFRASGRCVRCGAKRKRDCLFCQACIDYSGKHGTTRRKRFHAAGLCSTCGKRRPIPKTRWCKSCRKKDRICQARYDAKKKRAAALGK